MVSQEPTSEKEHQNRTTTFSDRPLTAKTLFAGFALNILLVGAIASLYYFAPRDVQISLAINHQSPELAEFWTATFVHEHGPGDTHLRQNLVVFLVLSIYAWQMYLFSGAGRAYWKALFIMLVPGAIIVNLISYLVYGPLLGLPVLYGRGFSGVVAEMTGFLLISTVSFALVLGLATYQNEEFRLRTWIGSNWSILLLAACSVPLVTLSFGGLMLVEISAREGSFVNVLGHGVGIIVGMLLAYRYVPFQNLLPEGVTVS